MNKSRPIHLVFAQWLFIGAFLIGLGCLAESQTTDLQGRELAAPRPIEALATDAVQPPQPNQSYLVKQMQWRMAACLAPMLWELGEAAPNIPAPFSPGDAMFYPTWWRVDRQEFRFREPYHRAGIATHLTFSNARWDPERSNVQYGTPRLAQDVEVISDGKTKLIQNDSDAAVHVAYTESESITDSFSTSVTHGLTLDVTVSSTTTVSGGYAGVEASETLTAEFGVSKTSEETHEQSEEGTSEASINIDFVAAPTEYYLVTIKKDHQTTYTDFDILGVMDFDLQIALPHPLIGGRQSHRAPPGAIHLQGVAGLEQFVYGYDTRYPSMAGFWGRAYSRTKAGIECVLDAAHRTIHVSGVNQANLEGSADYHVESLGHDVPDHMAHLPVESASDLADGGGK